MAARFRTAGLYNPGATSARYEQAARVRQQLGRAERRRKDTTLNADLRVAGDAAMFPLAERYSSIVERVKALIQKQPTDLAPYKSSALQIIESAVCGATYDPFLPANAAREKLRTDLRRLPRNTGRDTAAKSLVQGSSCAASWDTVAEALGAGATGYEIALQALAPNGADPYEMGGPCECTKGVSHVAHSNPFAPCRKLPSVRFRDAQKTFIRDFKLLVKEAQDMHAAVLPAACEASVGEAVEARASDQRALSARLDMRAQRQAQQTSLPTIDGTIDSFFGKTGLTTQTSAEAVQSSPETDAAIERAVQQEVELIDMRCRSGTDRAATAYRFRCGATEPGAEPMGARDTVLMAIDECRANIKQYTPVRSKVSPLPTVRTVCGVPMLELPVPEEMLDAVTVDFDNEVCMRQLRARGQSCVPCHRAGCVSNTKPLSGNKSYSPDSRAPWLILSADGSVKVGSSRKSECTTCKTYFVSLSQQPGQKFKVVPSLFQFYHANPVTMSRMPPSIVNRLPIEPDFCNPNSEIWLDTTISRPLMHDVMHHQTFEDMARKFTTAANIRHSLHHDRFEDELDHWDRSLRDTVSDERWADMPAKHRLQFAHHRAMYLYYRDHRDQLPAPTPWTRRPQATMYQATFDEVAERRRLAATVDCQSGIPKTDISVDSTFYMASKVNLPHQGTELSYDTEADALTNHNKQFVSYTSDEGRILQLRFANSGTAAESARGLEQIAQRRGYPTGGLVVNIDNVPPTSTGTSSMAQVLMTASGADWVGQDNFHVALNFSTAANNHHPDYHTFIILGFRNATRRRVAAIEREVDIRVKQGMVKLKRTVATGVRGARATHTIRPWKHEQLALTAAFQAAADPAERSARMDAINALAKSHVTDKLLDEWKRNGVYHSFFSVSKDGGVVVPYELPGPGDAAVGMAEYEANIIESQYRQLLSFKTGDAVQLIKNLNVKRGVTGIVTAVSAAAIVATGKISVRWGKATNPSSVKLSVVTFTDRDLAWSRATHVVTDRDKVREYVGRFEFTFRGRDDGYTGRPLFASLDNMLRETANAALRMTKCRPPNGVAQYEPARDRTTGEQLHRQGMPVYRQLHGSSNSELNHLRVQRLVSADGLRAATVAGLLTLGVQDLNRLNDEAAGVATPGHNELPLMHRRKRRRVDNPDLFGTGMPKELLNLTVPSADAWKRAAPSNSPADQVALPLLGAFDATSGRAGRSGKRVNPVVAPMPVDPDPRKVLPPPIDGHPVDDDKLVSAANFRVDFATFVDGLKGRIRQAEASMTGCSLSEASAVSARAALARSLHELSVEAMSKWGVSTDGLSVVPPPSTNAPVTSALPMSPAQVHVDFSAARADSTPQLAVQAGSHTSARNIEPSFAGPEGEPEIDTSFIGAMSNSLSDWFAAVVPGLKRAPDRDASQLPSPLKRARHPGPGKCPRVQGEGSCAPKLVYGFSGNSSSNWPCTCGATTGAPNKGFQTGDRVCVVLRAVKKSKTADRQPRADNLLGSVASVDGVDFNCSVGMVTVELDGTARGTKMHSVPATDVRVWRPRGTTKGSTQTNCTEACLRKTMVTAQQLPHIGKEVTVNVVGRSGTLRCDGSSIKLGVKHNRAGILQGWTWIE